MVYGLKKKLPHGFGKIGHFGTLDPFASGLVLVGIAGASRLNDLVHEYLPKTYLAVGKIGEQTDSADETGQVIASLSPAELESHRFFKTESREISQKIREQFMAQDYWQVPPSFSAAKHEGKPLYEYARAGIMIEKPAVKREILSFEILNIDKKAREIVFRTTVGSGTYIRTFFEDFLKCFELKGHLSELKREAIGDLALNKIVGLPNLEGPKSDTNKWSLNQALEYGICPTAMMPFETLELPEELQQRFFQGVRLSLSRFDAQGVSLEKPVWIKDSSYQLRALAEVREGELCLVINFPPIGPV